jgi:hypothetical protein
MYIIIIKDQQKLKNLIVTIRKNNNSFLGQIYRSALKII